MTAFQHLKVLSGFIHLMNMLSTPISVNTSLVPEPNPCQQDLAYWLALQRAPRVGSITFAKLLKAFGEPRQVFHATHQQWETAGLTKNLQAYLRSPAWAAVEKDLAWLEQPRHHILTWNQAEYPARLKEIHDPPPLLFVQGQVELLSMPQLAVVGSRNPSQTGQETAHEFAQYLSSIGWVITSGMAFGIDVASHQGALAANASTIAVAGTGLNTVYPARHQQLAEQIRQTGAIISEFPPDMPARQQHFPRRNRIISGMSVGTLVVEATLRSGSLITARQAAEQGREVFAIPGSIHNPLAKGCHALIKDGAKLVESADDIVEELAPFVPGIAVLPSTSLSPAQHHAQKDTLDEEYVQLLNHMGVDEPLSVDILVERCGLTAEAVSSMLLILELRGRVNSLPGGSYARVGY